MKDIRQRMSEDMKLMYTCGLGVSEAVHLRPEEIDSQRMFTKFATMACGVHRIARNC